MSDTAPPTEQETKVLNSNPTTRPLGRVGAFAPGGYICKCIACGEVFGGDKRALNCLNCAIDALQAATPPSAERTTEDWCNSETVGELRLAAHRVTGGNCTFADDDIKVLEHLAQRAVDAGLTDKLAPDVKRHAETPHDLRWSFATAPSAVPAGWVSALHVLFDGPPGPEAGRFIEVETPDGRSVNAGEWRERADHPGWWELIIPCAAAPPPPSPPSREEIARVIDPTGFEEGPVYSPIHIMPREFRRVTALDKADSILSLWGRTDGV